MADPPRYPDCGTITGIPRWVKVFGIIVIVVVLLFVVIQLTGVGGDHGPGRHAPSGHVGGQTPPESGHG